MGISVGTEPGTACLQNKHIIFREVIQFVFNWYTLLDDRECFET